MICEDKNGNPIDIGMFVKYEETGKFPIYGMVESIGRKPETVCIEPMDYTMKSFDIPFGQFERLMPKIYSNSNYDKISRGIFHFDLKEISVLSQGKQKWQDVAASRLMKDGNIGLFFITNNYIGIAYSRSMRYSVELETAEDFNDFSLPKNWYDVKDFEVQDAVSIYCFGDSEDYFEGDNGWHLIKTFGFDPKLPAAKTSQMARNLIPKLFRIALKGTDSFDEDIRPILGQHSSVCIDGGTDDIDCDDPVRKITPYNYGDIGNGYEPSNDEILAEEGVFYEDEDEDMDLELEMREAIKQEEEEMGQVYDSFSDYNGYTDGMGRYANQNSPRQDDKEDYLDKAYEDENF